MITLATIILYTLNNCTVAKQNHKFKLSHDHVYTAKFVNRWKEYIVVFAIDIIKSLRQLTSSTQKGNVEMCVV